MEPCTKPGCNGIMQGTSDMYGEYVRCMTCATEIHPPVDPELLKIRRGRGAQTPAHGKDTYLWKEKNTWTDRERIRRRNKVK